MALWIIGAVLMVIAMTASASPDAQGWRRDAGTRVDLTEWAYQWRADRKVQRQPEAAFIPRRLERLDRIYRTAAQVLPPDQLKSIYYDMPDLLKPFPPAPNGTLLTGLLWTGGLADLTVEVRWRRGAVPNPDDVEVRSYPTAYGWFGWTVDRVLRRVHVSADGRTWRYRTNPSEMMDHAYNVRVPAATEMIAVFGDKGIAGVPDLKVTSPNLGVWRETSVLIEWGVGASAGKSFDGRLEAYVARLGPIAPIAGDTSTEVLGSRRWRSAASGASRRGIVVPMLYAPNARSGLDSRITIRTPSGAATISIRDLDRGPIWLPRHGLFIARPDGGLTASAHLAALAQRPRKSIRAMTREHAEYASWDDLMQRVRLWACPKGTTARPFPNVPEPPMKVRVSDGRWTDAWNAAAHQLTGAHMWGGLAFEVARVTRAMEMIGLHEHAERVYEHFLKGPGAKPDGDYSDGSGALEWATSLRHDMGYSHDGTHASTGRLLLSMAERVFLTGDLEWLRQRRERLQEAADWIIRQRTGYLRDLPNRSRLAAAGLMPPCMLGDYAIPSCDWHWYYVDNALALQGLRRFADALRLIDPAAARKYAHEADAFARDLRRAVEREAQLAPVRMGRDGVWRQFIPRMAYARGLTGPELGAPQFPDCDLWMGALPLAEPYGGIEPDDPRMVDTLDVMEEMGTSETAIKAAEQARRAQRMSADDAWFCHTYSILPKASHTANVYLLQDDVPNFLRFWMNHYAITVGADGKLWEHAHPGTFDVCGAPDNGTAGWFIENFRNALVMEDGPTLWLARATPRAWLADGKKIEVRNAPTWFGKVDYEIASEAAHGRIRARISIPERSAARAVILRLRHPEAASLRSVTVNGKRCQAFDARKETIRLTGLKGDVSVVATY